MPHYVEYVDPASSTVCIRLGPFTRAAQVPSKLAFVVHYADGSWDNNGGKDSFIPFAAATGVEGPADVPAAFGLRTNYPNPFNPATTIEYALNRRGAVDIRVYDLLGREVALLVSGVQDAGTHRVIFNAGGLRSGMYVCRFVAEGKRERRKTVLLR